MCASIDDVLMNFRMVEQGKYGFGIDRRIRFNLLIGFGLDLYHSFISLKEAYQLVPGNHVGRL